MRKFASVFMIVALSTACSQAALTMFDDFESYDLGSIDMKGEFIEYGFPIEIWNAQQNGGNRGDHEYSNVVVEDGDKCLEMINRDVSNNDKTDSVFTCAYLGEANAIYNMGTIYLRYKSVNATDCIFATNDLYPGYPSDVPGSPDATNDAYQDVDNWPAMGSMIELGGGGELFRARDGGTYRETTPAVESDTWYELWSQVDCVARKTRFYFCENGGTPTLIMNPAGGEWWAWRNQTHTNYSVVNIKFFMGLNFAAEYRVYIDTLAIDTEAYTTDRVDDADPITPCLGDANGDKTVDIQDFVILKQNYGTTTGATWEMGDFNGDGAVDIQDFVILKQNYGSSCE